MNPRDRIVALGRDAWSRSNQNSYAVLPFANEALRVVESEPDQNEIVTAFRSAYLSGADPEFIQVCVHMLQWPSLRACFEALLREAQDKPDLRAIPVLKSILRSFDKNWEDRDLFYGNFYP